MSSVMDRLSDEDKKELVKLALDSANELGLCSDTVNVLKEMGFDTSDGEKKRITLVVDVVIPYGDNFDINDWSFMYTTDEGDEFTVSYNDDEVVSIDVEDR